MAKKGELDSILYTISLKGLLSPSLAITVATSLPSGVPVLIEKAVSWSSRNIGVAIFNIIYDDGDGCLFNSS